MRIERYLGTAPDVPVAELEEAFGEFTSESTIEGLREQLDSDPGRGETERRALEILRQSAEAGFLQRSLAGIDAELVERINAGESGDARTAFPASGFFGWFGPEEERGRETFEVLRGAAGRFADLIEERCRVYRDGAIGLGYSDGAALIGCIAGIPVSRLSDSAERFLAETAEAYRAAIAALRESLAPAEIPGRAADLPELAGRFERTDLFKGIALRPFYRHLLENFGFSESLVERIDVRDPGPARRTAWFQTLSPDIVRFFISNSDGAASYLHFLRCFGGAQSRAWISSGLLESNPEFAFAQDDALLRGYGRLFQTLFLDRGFLIRDLNVRDDAAVSALLAENRFRQLFTARREMLRSRLELDALSDTANGFSKICENYAGEFTDALGFRFEPEEVALELSPHFRAHARMRGIAFAFGLREYLAERYDAEWWRRRGAFEELIDLWNTAGRYSAEELAGMVGFEAGPDQLGRRLTAAG